MAKPEFIEITPEEFDLWEKFVKHSAQNSIFSTPDFYVALSEADFDPRIFAVQKGQHLHAGCLVTVKRKGPFTVAAPIPHVTYNGILMLDKDTESRSKIESLYDESLNVLATGLEQRFDYVMIDQQPSFEDVRPLYARGWNAQPRYTYHIDLDEDFESNFEKEARREIEAGREAGVNFTNDGSIKDVINAYQGSNKPLSEDEEKLLRSTAEALGKRACIYVADTSDASGVSAAGIVVHDGDKAQYLFGATPVDSRSNHVSAVLIAEMCQDLSQYIDRIDVTGGHAPKVGRFYRRFSSSLTQFERTTYGTVPSRAARKIATITNDHL